MDTAKSVFIQIFTSIFQHQFYLFKSTDSLWHTTNDYMICVGTGVRQGRLLLPRR